MLNLKYAKIQDSDLSAVLYVLKRLRLVIILLFVGIVLFTSDQGGDLLISIVEDDDEWRFAVVITLWAVSVWVWGRMLLNISFPDQPGAIVAFNRGRRWVPRFMGFSVYLVALIGILNAGSAASSLLGWLFIGIAFVYLTWKRHDYVDSLKKREHPSYLTRKVLSILDGPKITDDSQPIFNNWKDSLAGVQNATLTQALTTRRGLVVLGVMLFGSGLAVASCIWPLQVGEYIGVLPLFLFWAITLLPFGTILTYWADQTGWPLLTGLLLITVASSWTNDNHKIRIAETPINIDARKTVTEALNDWGNANASDDMSAVPFVIVSTAGGGIRAAYWTGTVLGSLRDNTQPTYFDRQLFAISGVSGGSVGATMYRALISSSELPPGCNNSATGCMQQILGRDFLGPVAAGMLYPDLIQRFLFYPVFEDRGVALEKSWEAAYSTVTQDNNHSLKESLAGLSQQSRSWPALFLNSTWVENGRRIVASNLRFDTQPGYEARAFSRSNDQLAILGHDISLSTAAHNSARFPFVSPPGMWRNSEGDIAGRLQDGGLFENYGAETAMEIIELACSVFECDSKNNQSSQSSIQKRMAIKPIVILISSDPTIPDVLSDSPPGEPIGFAYEMRTTGATYEHARSGHAAEAAARLQKMAEDRNGSFYHFRMCNDMDTNSPPLGWALSKNAQNTIRNYLNPKEDNNHTSVGCTERNSLALAEIVKIIEEP